MFEFQRTAYSQCRRRLDHIGPQGNGTTEEEERTLSSAMTRRLLAPAIAAAMLIALLLPGLAIAKQANHSDNGKGKVVSVMTRNLYLGADLGPVIAAENTEDVVTASGSVLRDVIANDFPTRAKGLADEIRSTKPDLVGLQEVAYWQTTPITPAGKALTIDYL